MHGKKFTLKKLSFCLFSTNLETRNTVEFSANTSNHWFGPEFRELGDSYCQSDLRTEFPDPDLVGNEYKRQHLHSTPKG